MRIEDLYSIPFLYSLSFSWMSYCFIHDTFLQLHRCSILLYISIGWYYWNVIRNVYCLLNSRYTFYDSLNNLDTKLQPTSHQHPLTHSKWLTIGALTKQPKFLQTLFIWLVWRKHYSFSCFPMSKPALNLRVVQTDSTWIHQIVLSRQKSTKRVFNL